MSSSKELVYDKSDYNCFIIVLSKDNRSIWSLLKHVISLSVQLSQVVGAISTVSSVKLSVKITVKMTLKWSLYLHTRHSSGWYGQFRTRLNKDFLGIFQSSL